MIQYKLTQEYPGSPILGTIYWYKNDGSYSTSSNNWLGTNFYDAHPKFWQKVEEVDYEILSFVAFGTTLKKDSQLKDTFCERDGFSPFFSLENLTKTTNAKINSVKRLSDGEVFTIGDIIKGYKNTGIKEITINSYGITIITDAKGDGCVTDRLGWKLKDCIKLKTPLFTTEDGVDIFEGDDFCIVQKSNFDCIKKCTYKPDFRYWICFSTKEEAEHYILFKKPILSLNDLLAAWGNAERPDKSLLFKRFKELAKSKL